MLRQVRCWITLNEFIMIIMFSKRSIRVPGKREHGPQKNANNINISGMHMRRLSSYQMNRDILHDLTEAENSIESNK